MKPRNCHSIAASYALIVAGVLTSVPTVSAAPQEYADAVISDGPVLYYRLDEGAGDLADGRLSRLRFSYTLTAGSGAKNRLSGFSKQDFWSSVGYALNSVGEVIFS